jgi:hypothetical protein
MTIAAGLLYEGGIALCADTLMSGTMSGHYESKVMGYEFCDGLAIFALAGYATFAQSAIQQCADVLANPLKQRTHRRIADDLRPILGRAFKQQVVDSGLPSEDPAYKLITAIWSRLDGLGLYYSDLGAFARSTTGYQFAGSGSELAELFIRPLYQQAAMMELKIADQEILPLAAYALARVREFQPHYVGGDAVICVIRDDGSYGFMRKKDLELLNKASGIFDVGIFSMLKAFLTADKTDDFTGAVANISPMIQNGKEEWLKQQKSILWAAVTHHAKKVVVKLANKRKQFV